LIASFATLAPVTGSFVGLLLGVAMGARHALDPDHLAAVSVLSADAPGPRRGALLGALWGVGHAAALLGTGVVLSALAADLPAALADAFELAVAAMLMVLGGRAMYRARRAPHVHVVGHRRAMRPLIVGAVHGLAGSGALTALVMTRLPSTAERLSFMLLFGLGSVAAMSAISGAAGWPLARLARSPRASRFLSVIAGTMSVALGIGWAWIAARRLFE